MQILTYSYLHYSDLFLPVKRSSFKSQNWAPRVAFHTMKFWHRHGADGAKGPGKSRLRWSWMRWLSLRGWHWWLQWWADRLWQWEDLGISGALGGEHRKHHEPLFFKICSLWLKVEFMSFPHPWCCSWIEMSIWQPDTTDDCFKSTSANQQLHSTSLTIQTGCQEVTEMQVWVERGLGTPWLIGVEWYWDSIFIITVCRVCPPK